MRKRIKRLKLNLAYIAGFFDGEGSIGVYKNSRNNGYSFRVQLVQSVGKHSTALFYSLKRKFGGSVSIQLTSHRPKYNYQLSSKNGIKFLQSLLPYLFFKKEQTEVVLKWLHSRPKPRRNKRGQMVSTKIPTDKVVSQKLKRLKRL